MSEEVRELKEQIALLQQQVSELKHAGQSYYYSEDAIHDWYASPEIPAHGRDAKTVKTIIENNHILDFNQELNTSSYVNVSFEPEEEEIALMGLRVNLADQTVYTQSYKMHDVVVNMIAKLWHCPEPKDFEETGTFPGAGTVGSTEACLLAGLALKFRWREWYRARHNLSEEEVLGKRPNIVMSTCYQAAWEKLFKYMDVDCKLIQPSIDGFKITAEQVGDAIDEHTMGVVCIMGNHYGGHYDPVWDINDVITQVNNQKGFQVGIHVDAASGGFIAPFQKNLPAWDFRLSNVLSISSSGHKYGESCCGTGWIVWRHREGLSEHVAISVTYLGGKADSYTLNFSRPASGIYVQYYKFLRHGLSGYDRICENMMDNARVIREGLMAMKAPDGKPRFKILDDGERHCLPVVAAMLNPECEFTFDDIDLQHVLAQHHWYVSGYKLGFNHPTKEHMLPLLNDASVDQTMFRVVVKSNLTRAMARNLLQSFEEAFALLDKVDFSALHGFDTIELRHKDQRLISNHC